MLHIRLAASRALLLSSFVGVLGLFAAPVPAQEHGPDPGEAGREPAEAAAEAVPEAAEEAPIEPPTKRREPLDVDDTVNLETPG